MILFTILLLFLIVFAILAILVIGTSGIALAIIFGDLIVCLCIIVMIVRHFVKR